MQRMKWAARVWQHQLKLFFLCASMVSMWTEGHWIYCVHTHCISSKEEDEHPICQHVAAPFHPLLTGLQLFCEDGLYRELLSCHTLLQISVWQVPSIERSSFCVSWPKPLIHTPYPNVSYINLPNSDLWYLFFFCFVALCYLVYMYYKVYIQITKSEKIAFYFG